MNITNTGSSVTSERSNGINEKCLKVDGEKFAWFCDRTSGKGKCVEWQAGLSDCDVWAWVVIISSQAAARSGKHGWWMGT